MKICPVSGKVCNKERTYHITDLKHGEVIQHVDLCEDCVVEYCGGKTHSESPLKTSELPPEAISGMLDFFQKVLKTIETQKLKSQESQACQKCGSTVEDIYKNGKLGCAECYSAFNVDSLLMKIHGATQHVGKVPKMWKENKKRREQENILFNFHKLLDKKIASLLEKEEYETLAKIKQMCEDVSTLESIISDLKQKLEVSSSEESERIKKELDANITKCVAIQETVLRT